MYSVVKESNTRWHVLEVPTNQNVYTVKTEKDARDMVRSLNLGSGFNGFTPTFMTVQYLLCKQKERPSNE